VSRERYERLSVPLQIKVVRWVNRVVAAAAGGRRPLARAEKALRRVQDLIDLYQPFLLDNEPVFEAAHVELLTAALPDEERDAFGVDVRRLDWYDYWVNLHIPALRKWSYPLIEGRRPPTTAPAPVSPEPATQGQQREAMAIAERAEVEWPRS